MKRITLTLAALFLLALPAAGQTIPTTAPGKLYALWGATPTGCWKGANDAGTRIVKKTGTIRGASADPWGGLVATGGRCTVPPLVAWRERYPTIPQPTSGVHSYCNKDVSAESNRAASVVLMVTGTTRCQDIADFELLADSRLGQRLIDEAARRGGFDFTPRPDTCPGWSPGPIPADVRARCQVWYDDLPAQCCWQEYSDFVTGRKVLCSKRTSCLSPVVVEPPSPPDPCGDGTCAPGEEETCPADCPVVEPPPPPEDDACTAALDLLEAALETARASCGGAS